MKPGDRVRYCGKYQVYQGIDLIIKSFLQGQASCFMPDGSITTWLDPSDLEAIY